MRREEAITRLPVTYRRALLLVASGFSHDAIAEQLGVEPHAVPSLISLAEAKLARLTDQPASDGPVDDPREGTLS